MNTRKVNGGQVTGLVTARIPIEYKMRFYREAARNNMGISEYVNCLLINHCIETKEDGGGVEPVDRVPQKPAEPVRTKKAGQAPKKPVQIKTEDVIEERSALALSKTIRDEILKKVTDESGNTDWDEYTRLSKEAGLYDEKFQEHRKELKRQKS